MTRRNALAIESRMSFQLPSVVRARVLIRDVGHTVARYFQAQIGLTGAKLVAVGGDVGHESGHGCTFYARAEKGHPARAQHGGSTRAGWAEPCTVRTVGRSLIRC